LAGKKLCLVSILRAGNGLLDGILELGRRRGSAHIGPLPRAAQPRVQAIEY